ncbi:hypothetical protein M422DRAFT_169568 [Sphaerobolus stellatus SS14]|uniref:Uncharacterized protein n=1 Tax=Sphaerobolus stellatus (strain SS14) TaxID=990650 RepID=A0A0C9VXP6_SPHS4|nr:hypothetical protein M422DRAFT_169568 [Sphaerobolus stellatus SS14]
MSSIITGKAAMPPPGSNRAPKTFEGSEDEIAEFLELFENCADDSQLPDTEKVPFLFRYLSRGQKDVFKTFDGYSPADWTVFKAAIQEAFEGAFTEKKYTRQSLIQFTRKHSAKVLSADSELHAYHREFQAIAHYLVNEKIISKEERDRYYWFGLHEHTRRLVELRLAITHPNHTRTAPYDFADIFKAATTLLTKAAPLHTASIMELDVKIQGKYSEVGIYDSGAELVCISEIAAKEMGLPFSCDLQLNMRDANGGKKMTFRIIENLELVIGSVSVYVHTWIIRNAPYRLLLG